MAKGTWSGKRKHARNSDQEDDRPLLLVGDRALSSGKAPTESRKKGVDVISRRTVRPIGNASPEENQSSLFKKNEHQRKGNLP